MVMCGLRYLSCEHFSELLVMSSTCLFLPKAKDVFDSEMVTFEGKVAQVMS